MKPSYQLFLAVMWVSVSPFATVEAGLTPAEMALGAAREQIQYAVAGLDRAKGNSRTTENELNVSIARTFSPDSIWLNPDASMDSAQVTPLTSSEPKGLYPTRVALWRDGAVMSSGQVTFRVARFGMVAIATRLISRGECGGGEEVTLKRMEITNLAAEPITAIEQFRDRSYRHNIQPGTIISHNDIALAADIKAGDKVTIEFQRGTMSVAADGAALETGHVGETIRVRNNSSKKVITATVLAPGVVSVVRKG